MENIRLILIFALILISLMLYQAWQEDYATKPPLNVTSIPTSDDTPTVSPASTDSELPVMTDSQVGPVDLSATPAKQLLPSQSHIYVKTDIFQIEIDTIGGDVRQVDLLKYPVESKTRDNPFR